MLKALFWGSTGLLLYTHAGYPLLLRALAGPPPPETPGGEGEELPTVSLIVAAYDEQDVIAAKVRGALALDYPEDRLEVVVASDGSGDRTAERAREAGAHLVLDLPRGGKIRAQDRAVEESTGEILAFSDANSIWAPDALRRLVVPFGAHERTGYVCGQVRFVNESGTNQEGLYWRYEMAVRALESRWAGVTAGNGAIYAVRRESYLVVDPRMGHDLSFPFNLVKRGWRALYAPDARAEEKMVPSIEGEFARKRRMMSHAWAIVLEGGLLSPRGYPASYALEMVSHRVLRYASPFLHLAALASSVALRHRGRLYAAALAAQLGLAGAAALGPVAGLRAFRLAYYYVLVTASLAAGLLDYLRTGTPAEWEKAEGTR